MFKAHNISSLCMASAGSEDYKTGVENLDIRAAEEVFYVPCPEHSCSQEFLELAEILKEENGLLMLTRSRQLILFLINFHCKYKLDIPYMIMLTFS